MKEYSKRRRQLMESIGSKGMAVLPSAPLNGRSRTPFRQDSTFYYLSGFVEPEAVVALVPGREHGEYILFCRDKNPEKERWDGVRTGPEKAIEMFGVDDAFPIEDIDDILPGMMEGREKLYYPMGGDPAFDQRVIGWLNTIRARSRSGVVPPQEIVSLDHLVNEMRLFKSPKELKLMQRAADISARAHTLAMQKCRPGMYEYEIEAHLHYEFRRHGAIPAYASIVAGGRNGCVLHYIDNNAKLRSGDLLLIDSGAEYGYYAADISRTFPVNGKFSTAQQALYEVVLAAQKAAIEEVRPGNDWNAPHLKTVEILTQGLIDLGILKGELKALISEEASDVSLESRPLGYRDVFMHRTGHWLGMDVHDVGDYKIAGEWRVFEPSMVTTIEPGLYIPAIPQIPERWHNIAIRIEDDVLVTSKGHRVLTEAAPKEISEIEGLMKGQ
jgi:Xaa-Pro aminopeptidase